MLFRDLLCLAGQLDARAETGPTLSGQEIRAIVATLYDAAERAAVLEGLPVPREARRPWQRDDTGTVVELHLARKLAAAESVS